MAVLVAATAETVRTVARAVVTVVVATVVVALVAARLAVVVLAVTAGVKAEPEAVVGLEEHQEARGCRGPRLPNRSLQDTGRMRLHPRDAHGFQADIGVAVHLLQDSCSRPSRDRNSPDLY